MEQISAIRTGMDLFPLELRPWRPGDEHALLRCHNDVFAPPGSGHPPRELEHWHWKFRDNPAGDVSVLLANHVSGDVVGIFAVYPVRVSIRGRRMLAGHGVDHCLKPEWVRHGGGDGLFPRMARQFFADWLGRNKDQYTFLYGLPVQGFNSGSKNLGWKIVRDWDITFRELPAGEAPRQPSATMNVTVVDRFGDDVDRLFAEIEPSLGVATVRDQTYLNWRYADHPDNDYTLFECRERATGKLRGICVYGIGNVSRDHTGCILDWLHHSGDDDTMQSLLAAAEARAREDKTGILCAVWNAMDARFVDIQRHGYMVRGTPWFLVLESALYDVAYFREGWYFTLGDSDLA